MIKSKKYLCAVAVYLCFFSAGFAQQQLPPDGLPKFPDKYLPDSYLALAAEGTFTTYGAGFSFPVFWIEERLKIVPLVGFMWQNFTSNGFQSRTAAGSKLLFHFQKQPIDAAFVNSFYLGAGGMATITQFFGETETDHSRVGAIAGYDLTIGQSVRLAPELLLGVNQTGRFRAEIGFVIYFGL